MVSRYFLLAPVFLLFIASPIRAEELPNATLDALERFYHEFNGDEWDNNDGWLDTAVDPCDWHGVRCGFSGGQFGIEALQLPRNNLAGPLDGTDIFEHVKDWVDLRGNGIHGSLSALPHWLDHLDLSDNELSGSLPEGPDTFGNSPLEHLGLARNGFSGSVPTSWEMLGVQHLDLSGNALEGSLEPLALAGPSTGLGFLNIADNRFQGELPSSLMTARLRRHNEQATAGGINLCWNDFQAGDAEIASWVAERHVGGEFESCIGRERLEIGPEVSGSWFDPDRDGEGVVMHLLPDAGTLIYAFGFDNAGRQHWLLGVGFEDGMSLHWPEPFATRGRFGEGRGDGPWPVGPLPKGFATNWRMDRVGPGGFHFERTYHDSSDCPDGGPSLCPADSLSDRLDYVQLTRLAGTACDNPHENQWISGAWYDPERDGEGFVVEVLEDGRGVVYWFTYRPDDSMHQAWMMGVGEFTGQVLQVDDLIRPVGGLWGDEFDASDVDFEHWGGLTLEFLDQDAGHVSWDSVQEGFGSGEHPIVRLSRVRLADCEGE